MRHFRLFAPVVQCASARLTRLAFASRMLFVGLLLLHAITVVGQEVSNVSFMLNGRELAIDYRLSAVADIQVRVSVDAGRSFSDPLENLSGDVGKKVKPGENHIIAYDLREIRGVDSSQLVFKVEVDDGSLDIYLPNSISFKMLPVEGGSFRMGCVRKDAGKHNYDNEFPVHKVTVSSFYIGQHEVTQGLWKAVMDENPSFWTDNDSLPVEQVSWNDVQIFVARLSQMTGKHFRLPTEAEWEFAARGGVHSHSYVFPGTEGAAQDYIWFCVNSEGRTHKVGQKRPNELGLYDMGGNVWEWCSDWMGAYSDEPQTDPLGPRTGENRILRGGSINSPSWGCRVSDRSWYLPDHGYRYYGFRLVMELDDDE